MSKCAHSTRKCSVNNLHNTVAHMISDRLNPVEEVYECVEGTWTEENGEISRSVIVLTQYFVHGAYLHRSGQGSSQSIKLKMVSEITTRQTSEGYAINIHEAGRESYHDISFAFSTPQDAESFKRKFNELKGL